MGEVGDYGCVDGAYMLRCGGRSTGGFWVMEGHVTRKRKAKTQDRCSGSFHGTESLGQIYGFS